MHANPNSSLSPNRRAVLGPLSPKCNALGGDGWSEGEDFGQPEASTEPERFPLTQPSPPLPAMGERACKRNAPISSEGTRV